MSALETMKVHGHQRNDMMIELDIFIFAPDISHII